MRLRLPKQLGAPPLTFRVEIAPPNGGSCQFQQLSMQFSSNYGRPLGQLRKLLLSSKQSKQPSWSQKWNRKSPANVFVPFHCHNCWMDVWWYYGYDSYFKFKDRKLDKDSTNNLCAIVMFRQLLPTRLNNIASIATSGHFYQAILSLTIQQGLRSPRTMVIVIAEVFSGRLGKSRMLNTPYQSSSKTLDPAWTILACPRSSE